jgi:hypothetical protein
MCHTLNNSESLHMVCDSQQLLNRKSIEVRGISSSHPPSRASLTNLALESLLGISAKRCGAKSFRHPSGSQLSNQKKVADPSPTTEQVAALKISVTIGGTWISYSFHDREAYTRLNQSHRARSARFIFGRFGILRPPNSFGIQTLSHATRQWPPCTFLRPFHKNP